MSQTRVFSVPGVDCSKIFAALRNWLEGENFETQLLHTESGETVVQAAKRGGWRNLIGQSTALNVIFDKKGDELHVTIGSGKWIDKAAVATVSMFVLWPLLVTSSIGAIKQMRLPGRVFNFLSEQIDRAMYGQDSAWT